MGGLNFDTILIIKLPDHMVFGVFSRSLFMAIVILMLPCIGSIVRGPFSSLPDDSDISSGPDLVDLDWLPLVLHELEEDGILKRGSKGLILSHGNEEKIDNLQYLRDTRISLIMVSDLHLIPDMDLDFVFYPDLN